MPSYPKYDPGLFSAQVKKLIAEFDRSHKVDKNIMTNDDLRALVQTLENGVHQVGTPLQRLEHFWHLPVAFLVIPVFALFNAGIPIAFGHLHETLTHPVALGVGVGLLAGKFIGISGSCWLAIKLGIAQLPAQTRFTQILGVSLLGGIGFTMAIFIAELGFSNHPDMLVLAKTGILGASLVAGISGFIWLWLAGRK